MKEILEAIGARIRSPLFGYYVLISVAINWKEFFNLFFSKTTALERIAYFDVNTDFNTLLWVPLFFAAFATVGYPWLNYFFLYFCKKPTDLRNSIQAQSEHNLIIKKQELEEARSKLLLNAESELFERAKRDDQLGEIENEEIRHKLQAEINMLREERDVLKSPIGTKPDYEEYKKLLELADRLRDRVAKTNSQDDRETFKQQARELEERAHKLIQGDKA